MNETMALWVKRQPTEVLRYIANTSSSQSPDELGKLAKEELECREYQYEDYISGVLDPRD